MGLTTAPVEGPAIASPSVAAARARARSENFPVALRILPKRRRESLYAAYALARHIDDVGDDPTVAPAARLAALAALETQLLTCWSGDPVLRALPIDAFLDLIAANEADQSVRRYRTYEDLLAYCALSANPIGRVVLAAFDVDDPALASLSDSVCTALQILEHCQDVAEDLRDRDRIYLPADDLVFFDVGEHDLHGPATPPAVRRLVERQVDRAALLLADGDLLVRRLHGFARIAIAGYVSGGRATVDALRRVDCAVLAGAPRPSRRDVVRHLARLLVAAR